VRTRDQRKQKQDLSTCLADKVKPNQQAAFDKNRGNSMPVLQDYLLHPKENPLKKAV
jgi:hypothetical protein